ncbi:MAG: hypothetical protein AAF556_04940 [Pseudomonadota bacterium]
MGQRLTGGGRSTQTSGHLVMTDDLGMTYRGRNAADIVQQMREITPGAQDDSIALFMREVAQRVEIACGERIRTANEEKFIADLVSAGFLEQRYEH